MKKIKLLLAKGYKIRLSKELIQKGINNLYDSEKCIGALMLGQFLRENNITHLKPSWGNSFGSVEQKSNSNNSLNITTKGEVNIMSITKPKTLTLILG